MDLADLLELLPLWALFLVTLAACVGAAEAGSTLAQRALLRKSEKEPEVPLGSIVGAMLGLLGFLLAFTFGMTASRFDLRRQLLLEEARTLGTTYRRASLMPDKQAREVRRLLRDYAEIRLSASPQTVSETLMQSEQIHDQLWSQAEELVDEEIDSELRSLFVASLNQLIELHLSRKTVVLQYRILGSIWAAVYVLAILSMLALGYQVGMSGTRRIRGTPIVAAAFALVIVMIADLDRPSQGFMRVNQQPIADVLQMMERNTP